MLVPDEDPAVNVSELLTKQLILSEGSVILSYAYHQSIGLAKLTRLRSLDGFHVDFMRIFTDPDEFFRDRYQAFRLASQVRQMI